MAIIVDPSIIITAFMLTTLLFVSFTMAAIFARDGTWIYIGGSLMTMLSTLITLSLANLFFGSKLLFDISIYLGLVVMCGFILYDTQLILEKVKLGDKDHVSHCIDLFIDFIGVFRRILIILHSREVENKKKEKKNE
uniref:Bax inhibitor 1 n=2 Tax=Cacopsylla melanoneura TaxID=428564 RepID=A0A8D8RUX9_9HEMI